MALALLLIAAGKFSRPLGALLPVAVLARVQAWMLDRAGKNAKAAAIIAQQHFAWLSEPSLVSEPSATVVMVAQPSRRSSS